ncbi:acetyl-CoA carboxylase [Streptomyces sp. A7024]|uniref:Acetyl-coenzyme A carboxylase carboxyl transferase subunits beta/alpha n=1 Tax=Streptomyces coryli TaxID=1128680 RepID=A0A6G4U222_9ACTN|nr:carboxyl transferase domain-containing protein [Streptomyces coryli]NGN66133.1 acetyl-CoA carboxylase [Streptomyces coryli]
MADHPTARDLIASVTDHFTELTVPPTPQPADGPLGWPGYDTQRTRAAARTGETESVVCGTARIGGVDTTLIAFEFGYLGGSLGERTGDRLEAAFTRARELRTPVVSLIATGGSRMQEGMRALIQLRRIAEQSAHTRAAGLPQVAVAYDPTTGGGWATLGAGADVTLAVPGAQIGFAGSRVRPPDADPAAYTAEDQHAHGHVDAVVPQDDLPQELARWLRLLTNPSREPADPPHALTGDGTSRPTGSGWTAVLRARAAERPRAGAYLDAYFTHRVTLSGDRCGGTDDGVTCGFGDHPTHGTIAYAAQLGTATRPEGYRTIARTIRLADRLRIPVLTLVDTPGAANDTEAERRGAGPAIAEVFAAVAESRTPITTLVIGEGGSGGALALTAPGRTWLTPDSYFSVIAPELATAILKRPPTATESTADDLRLRPQDMVDLGLAEGVIGE